MPSCGNWNNSTDKHSAVFRKRYGSLAAIAAGLTIAVAGCDSSTSHHASAPEYRLRESPMVVDLAADSTSDNDETLNNPTVEIEPWRFGAFRGQVIETENYRIHTTIDRAWAREDLPRFVEAALAHYTTALGELPMPNGELETYMFATRDQWADKAAELLPGQAAAYRNLGRGGLSTGGVALLYFIDYYDRPRDTFAIAAHEGWHQYTQTTFEHQMPVWIEEGVAAYMEGFHVARDGAFIFDPARNYERRRTLRRAVMHERLISLQEMVNRSPASFLQAGKEDLLVYYAQGWAMVRFLVEGEGRRYAQAFHRLLIDAAEGRLVGELLEFSPRSVSLRRASLAAAGSGDTVVRVYFNANIAEFESQYRAFITKILDEPMLLQQDSRHNGPDS